MKATTLIKAMALTAFLAGMSAAGVKYVAVVETEIDAQSGASDNLNPAEVREITAEIRRQAIENLPQDRYSVMTSETVQSMGGADYIVRGTIGKFQTRFTLKVEIYEADNGTLVATSEPVRTENVGELLDMATSVCGDMYRKFAGGKESAQKPKVKAEPKAIAKNSTLVPIESGYYIAPKYQTPLGTPVSWGGVNVEGGLIWGNGVFLGLDLSFGMGSEKITDSTGNGLGGIGINLGNVYDLGGQLQFVYGGSAGYWFAGTWHNYKYKGDDDARYLALSYLALFVKLRWEFVELSYRGFFGFKGVDYDKTWNSVSREYVWKTDVNDFTLNNHQLMLGLYFATSKRTR
ncbi:MAG: hypothetical protein LBC59_01390 [Chitinispirillales bacterium]|jgi:hypothetical protein|nr:hypothetical protein [Chitinispirillales bacterium]